MLEYQLTGWQALDKALQQLPEKIQRGALRAGMRGAAVHIRRGVVEEFDAKLTSRSGRLRKSIKARTMLVNGMPHAAVYTDVYYAHMIEGGTAPHLNKGLFAGTENPGFPAKPFFRPGFDKNVDAAIGKARDAAWAKIEKEGYQTPDRTPDGELL